MDLTALLPGLSSIATLVVLLPTSILISHLPFSQFVLAHEVPGQRVLLVPRPPPTRVISVSGTSVLGGPTLGSAFVNQVLAQSGSPAAGTGQALYDLSLQFGIDDAYALAVFQKESSFGKEGAGYADRSLGNIVCAGYPTCNGRFRCYPTWEAGYADFYHLLAREYVWRGLTTVETITPVYAPPVENNTELYIQQVRTSMLSWRAEQSQRPES